MKHDNPGLHIMHSFIHSVQRTYNLPGIAFPCNYLMVLLDWCYSLTM